jgi:hypothetical protein
MSNSSSKLQKDLESNPFPISTLDPNVKKKKSYGLQIAKNIYAKGALEEESSGRRAIAQENRDYAAGRQDINKYKPLLSAEIDNKGDSSYMNIDWSIQTPGKKYVDTIVGDMMNQDHKIQFNAIDNYSKQMLKKARDEYYGKIARRRDVIEMEQMSGLVMEKRDGFNPGSKEEVDVYMDMEFKQAVEIGMESIVDFELSQNHWSEKVSKRVVRDLVENNRGCVRLFFDRNGKISFRYVDIINYYASGTDEPDHNDTEYQAEKVMMSLGNLRKRDVHNEVTEAQWFKIAKTSSGKYGNASWRFGNSYNSSETYDGMAYSYADYRIEVLDFVFYTTDAYTYSEKEDKFGGTHISKKNHGYKKPERSKRKIEVHNKEIEMSYEGIWVPGSEILLGYERTKNILRPQTKDGKSISPELLRRYVYFEPNLRRGTSTSFVETIKPNLDTIQLLVLRKRHVIAEMNPTGVAIDVSGLSDVMSALEETDPLKIVALYKQKGILFFSRTDVNGDPVNGVPIQELGSQFAQSLMALDNAILNEISLIQQNGGINDARDGSAPDKDALVGIEKMRLLASNNTTRETYKAYTEGIFARVGKVIARMVQYKVAYGGGISEYDNIIGEQGVKSIEFAKSVTMAQMGIKVEALPTDDEIEALLNIMNVALGNQEIRLEDYLEIKRIPNIKKAERLLIYRKKVYAEEKMEEFRQKEEITGQREQQAAMAAAEAQKVKDESNANAMIQIEQMKSQLEKDKISHETLEKMKIIDREAYWKQQLLEQQIEGEGGGDQVDAPRIAQNPGGAVSRTTVVNP